MRYTFDQFVHYGACHGANIVNGMPWSFQFYGHPVSHENDDRYLVGVRSVPFNRGGVIIVDDNGNFTVFNL